VVTDLSSGLRELFFSPNDKYASKRGEKIFEEFLSKQLNANIWDAGYYSAAESLYPILIALVMIVIPYSQIVEVAILAALIDLIQKSITPIKDVASKIAVLARAKTGIERIHQFNESFSLRSFRFEDDEFPQAQSLSFNLIFFEYDQGFRLQDIRFELTKGEVFGILGESGSGKSTLLKLLSGQYNTFSGFIQIDDKKIIGDDENELRKFCSYVSLISQDSHVFTETLKFNLTLGADQGFEEFWEMAKTSIPYLTKWDFTPSKMVNPKSLSLGQKQLLSGLRALFLKKPIILMDEISSGLDSELELALRDLIKMFQSQTITIIVTHRLETILNSQKIMLLDKGKSLAIGPHESMMNLPQYREFLKHL
jgi:ABC-type multidrug transport system fused ATPase/permease subunit